MKNLSSGYSILALLLLSSCIGEPSTKDVRASAPERLIDTSLETKNLSLGTKNSVSALTKIVSEDRPSSAELGCSLSSTRCAQAKEIFERNSIPFSLSGEKANSVVLSYKKVSVRDCNPQYIDDMGGGRSVNHSGFGCAVASNTVQMVSNRRQFVEPNLLDFPDAEKAVQSYSEYQKPSSKREVKNTEWNNQTAVSR